MPRADVFGEFRGFTTPQIAGHTAFDRPAVDRKNGDVNVPVPQSLDDSVVQQRVAAMVDCRFAKLNDVAEKPAAAGFVTLDRFVRGSNGYAAIDRVNRAQGDVRRFGEILAEYEKSPAIMRKRLYLETMRSVLPKVQNKILTEGDGGGSLLPLLHLGTGLQSGGGH